MTQYKPKWLQETEDTTPQQYIMRWVWDEALNRPQVRHFLERKPDFWPEAINGNGVLYSTRTKSPSSVLKYFIGERKLKRMLGNKPLP